MVYLASTEALSDDGLFARLYAVLSEEHRVKIGRLRSKDDQKRSLAAYFLLQKALEKQGIHDFTCFLGSFGKPYLTHHDDIFFNLSHSGERAMCVLSDAEVGCDVERVCVRNNIERLTKRFFHVDEYRRITALESQKEQNELFVRLWTLKESLVKAVGSGFSMPIADLCCQGNGDCLTLEKEIGGRLFLARELPPEKGYRYAVCSTKPIEFEIEFLSLSE